MAGMQLKKLCMTGSFKLNEVLFCLCGSFNRIKTHTHWVVSNSTIREEVFYQHEHKEKLAVFHTTT